MAILEILFIDTSKTLPKPSVFKLPKHEIRWSLFAKKKKKKKKKKIKKGKKFSFKFLNPNFC